MKVITDNNKYDKVIKKVAKEVSKLFDLPKKSYISLSFVEAEEMKEINNETRKVDKVTDVLSFPNLDGIFGKKIELKDFPFDIDMENGMLYLGELVMCLDKIYEQAEEYGTGEMREFSYLLTHGILHCLGYDHILDEDKSIMRAKEEEVLNKIHV